MRVSAFLYHVMLYGALAIAVIAIVVWWQTPVAKDAKVPEATALGSPARRARHRLARVGAGWIFLVAALAAALLHIFSTDVVVVDDRGGHRMVYVGGDPTYPLPPGQTARHDDLFPEMWVVNQSSHDIKIVTLEYGKAFLYDNEPTIVPPGLAAQELDVDNLGPDDPPPDKVADETSLHSASRTWVTW